jgi:hypothetical protein
MERKQPLKIFIDWVPTSRKTVRHRRLPNPSLTRVVTPRRRRLLNQHRSSATRGWAAVAPRRGRERRELYARCGPTCFLVPGQLKFPVCPALREGNQRCHYDRRAFTAAKIRARQRGYPVVYKRAALLQKHFY